MKLTARVEQALHSGIHRIAVDRRDAEFVVDDVPLPTYVEIEVDDPDHAMLDSYRDDRTFCGDTWHESIQDAQEQATYEYGISSLANDCIDNCNQARRWAMQIIQALAAWYHQQCDGDWEHVYGITIETLDNPGWQVKIDLMHTELAGQPFQTIERLEPELAWIRCWVADQTFHAAGGPKQLEEILGIFLDWAKSIPK